MKILVTGATGFIGGALIDKLLKQKWEVTALVRRETESTSLKQRGVKIVFGDITDLDSLKKAVKGVDVVFNLAAALLHHNLPDREYWKVNVDGVKNLMAVCRKYETKRIVHISTVGIYGPTSEKGKDEKSELKLSNIYTRTKYEGEKIVLEHIKSGLPVTIIRPTIVYGPGDTRPGFLNLFVLIKKGLFIPIGKGDNFFHTIYIENLVEALVLVATAKKVVGQDFIIGDDPCPTMREIIEVIAKVQGKKLPNFYLPKWLACLVGFVFEPLRCLGLSVPLRVSRVNFITQNKKFIINKAKDILGYKPKVDLEEGVQRTFRWYKEKGYL
jgi:nucleoside-diphosphate-sugar epimerase